MSLGDTALHELLASIGAEVAVISAKHEGGRRIDDVHVEEADGDLPMTRTTD
jgi:hypothetical protein